MGVATRPGKLDPTGGRRPLRWPECFSSTGGVWTPGGELPLQIFVGVSVVFFFFRSSENENSSKQTGRRGWRSSLDHLGHWSFGSRVGAIATKTEAAKGEQKKNLNRTKKILERIDANSRATIELFRISYVFIFLFFFFYPFAWTPFLLLGREGNGEARGYHSARMSISVVRDTRPGPRDRRRWRDLSTKRLSIVASPPPRTAYPLGSAPRPGRRTLLSTTIIIIVGSPRNDYHINLTTIRKTTLFEFSDFHLTEGWEFQLVLANPTAVVTRFAQTNRLAELTRDFRK